jgi:iron complex outermembrane receptor protein
MKNIYAKVITLVVAFTFLSLSQLVAQTVTGVVTDEFGDPLPGASIVESGTTNGTTTDFDGNFTITSTSNGEFTLDVTFMGYKPQSKVFSGDAQWNVQLQPDAAVLEDVVVIGYGTVKKEDKTGAVYSVSDKDLQTVAVQDPIESIQGKIAGVTIRKGGSDPNAGFDVKIRGSVSLSSGTNPLYVIDGVVGADPTSVAPEDIATFNVLKDASSAAIYGSRGASGVILITTKQGKTGKSNIEFSSYTSMDNVAPQSRLDLMTADEYRAFGQSQGISVRDLGANTDWQDEIYRTGFSHNETVSMSGGSELGTYRASVSNNTLQGVVKNSGKDRLIMRLNAQTKGFNDKLTLSMNMAQTMEHNDYVNYGSSGADGVLYQAFQRNPTAPVYNPDGSYFQDPTPPVNNYSNPVAVLNDIENTRDAKRFLGNVKADLELFKGFTFTFNGGYIRNDSESSYFEPAGNTALFGDGRARRSYENYQSILLETFATYKTQIEDHSLELVGGYTNQFSTWDGFSAQGLFPSSDLTGADNLGGLAQVNPGDISSYRGESKLISGFGRVVYDYDKRYYFTGTLRRDGSSRFGANHQWGIFPSGSVAWNLKNESFLEDSDLFSMAKLRVGFGQTGNQEIGDYANIALFGAKAPVKDPITGKFVIPYDADQNPNPDLKWEVNTEINIGVDFGFLNDRINGSIDVFNKKTTDLIDRYRVNTSNNLVNTTLKNGGAIDINGIEMVLTGHIFTTEDLDWTSTLTFSHSKAVVVTLGTDEFNTAEKRLAGYLQEPLGYGTASQVLLKGEELGAFYGPKFVGIRASDGKFIYEKSDGTVATYDKLDPDKDYKVIGYSQPDFEIGWSNSFKFFKNFDASFVLRGMFGHQILNATNMVFDNPTYFPTRNVLSSAVERTELTEASNFSDYWLEDGDFVRLENIQIGYNFNTSNIEWLQRARVYASANNLLTLTSYSGIDPSSIGIDIFNVYPKSTTVTLGVNLTF